MQCDNCKKEETWLENIGSNFICSRCIQKHKEMGLIFRTHIDSFRRIIKKLKPHNYEEYTRLEKSQIEQVVELKKYGIKLR